MLRKPQAAAAAEPQLSLDTLHLHERPPEKGVTGKTMAIATERAETVGSKPEKVGIIAAGEVILSAPRSGEGLSLYALKTLLLMLQTAGGAAWREDVEHYISKGELMDLHSDSARIARTLHELATTEIVIAVKSERGLDAILQAPYLSERTTEIITARQARVYFRFSRAMQYALRNSEFFADINKLIALSLRSMYALKLYEIGTLFYRRRQSIWRVSVDELRRQLCVAEGAYPNWAQLERRVLRDPAAEVNQLAPFVIGWAVTRQGQGGRVTRVDVSFRPKGPGEQVEVGFNVEKASRARQKARPNAAGESGELPETAPGDMGSERVSPTLQTYARRLDQAKAKAKATRRDEVRQSNMPAEMLQALEDLRRGVPDDRQARLNLNPTEEASIFAVSGTDDPNEASWAQTIEIASRRAASAVDLDDPTPRAALRRRARG
ncbi:replication initiation protein [Belnapia moabensis]|uniref:replication initiation protein n=1 Tax=Belnapia moabensis TaxID=365533 RepID=UPI0005BAC398|nr:replication initiation protein [Belnapia moabensis]